MQRFLFAVALMLTACLPAQAQTGSITLNPPTGAGPLFWVPTIINNNAIATAAGVTNGMSNGSTRGMYVRMNDATNAAPALVAAGTFHQVQTGNSSGDKAGLIGNAYNCANCVSIGGWILGGDSSSTADVNSTQMVLAAHQFEVTSMGGASIQSRMGIVVSVDPGSVTSGTFDSAIVLDNYGYTGSQWANIFTLGSPYGNIVPLAPTGNFFNFNAPMTMANFVSGGNVTVTGNIMAFPNFVLAGSGAVAATNYGYKGPGGTATGTSCAAGTVNPATMVVQGGIITHC